MKGLAFTPRHISIRVCSRFEFQVGNLTTNKHTTQNGQYKWTKILSHETTIFGLKIMVKNALDFLF